LLLLVAWITGKAWALERFEFSQPAMGTLFRITCYADSQPQARSAADAAFQRVQALNAICSDYLPDSELIRLCRAGLR
jgi:thiamine biosynthesis lipoprotein